MTESAGIAERAFFREEFHHRTVVIALRDGNVTDVLGVVSELLSGGSQVVVVAGGGSGAADDLAAELDTLAGPPPDSADDVAVLWTALEDTGIRVLAAAEDPAGPAAELASRLGVHKLVVTDAAGGWGRSFASRADLEVTAAARPVVAAAVRQALDAGVGGVNVCRAEDLDVELFTFDGAGTLFTADAYVQVSRLRAADLGVVTQLVARGVAEGFLRPRPRVDVIRLALDGLGARVGPNRHLAGFGALETERYAEMALAEVSCLYTVNRYEGEGVGGQLVAGLIDAARIAGVEAIFACTVSGRAAALFERAGFHDVPLERIPDRKWVDYDPDRRATLSACWLDLANSSDTPVETSQP